MLLWYVSDFNKLASISFDERFEKAILATKSHLNSLLQNANNYKQFK